ncbi:SCO2524 family protein [Micromonospora carbonacea]|uniref:SCO2524 family protein n=1 Tax=Micromonospora carbonacea TaxID=47853 RepID=UPI003D749B48
MRMQPRQQLLEIWRATARLCYRDGTWVWGGRDGSNSISDAEQLLCLMLPATTDPRFVLERPDATADDALRALADLGDSIGVPRLLVRVLSEYLQRYTDPDGTPVFSGAGYFHVDGSDKVSAEQAGMDIVDSYTMSVRLSLAAIGFARVFRTVVTRAQLRAEIDELEEQASRRLTAAMVGLLRSFAVSAFEADSPAGRTLIRTVNQTGLPDRLVVESLWQGLTDVRAALRGVRISAPDVTDTLDHPGRLFECGWSWGVIRDAPEVDVGEEIGVQRPGVAEAAPYLYFSLAALNGIEELFSERTRILGLLTEEQERLALALQLRWEITQRYWSTVASFGTARWPLEDIPWRTTDDQESDYFSLLVTAMTVQDLIQQRSPDTELGRVARVLDELAGRARIVRRPFARDPAVALHSPGVLISLVGSEKAGPGRLLWPCTDFSPLLLKRMLGLAGLMRDPGLRGELLRQADEVWDHLSRRRISDGPARNLWDQVVNVYPFVDDRHDLPSWRYTERVVECLVAAARLTGGPPLRSERLVAYGEDLLLEAEHLFSQELLNGADTAGPAIRQHLQAVQAGLDRARRIIDTRPGTAAALATRVLQELDRLAAARRDVE